MVSLTFDLTLTISFISFHSPYTSPFVVMLLDPLVNSIVVDIFKTLIANPYTNQKIEQRLLPTLTSILNAPNHKDLSGLLTVF